MTLLRKSSLLILFNLIVLNISAQNIKHGITPENIYKNELFKEKDVEGIISMKDGIYYTVLENDSIIVKYSYRTGEKDSKVLDVSELRLNGVNKISDYAFNNDESGILFSTGVENIYRHSFKANYYIFELHSKDVYPLSSKGKQQQATFSPDGTKVAFMRDNNLFIFDVKLKREIQITNDGKYNEIINGIADWVYEEEFGFSKAFFWSGDSEKIAFYKFDESRVKQFNITLFNNLYPENYTFKYPKAGEDNSIVSVQVYDLKSRETNQMDIGEEEDQYISRIKWTKDSNILAIIRLNRLQNHVELLLADAASGESKVIYEERNKYFISETSDDFVTFLNDKERFVVFSERDGYMHFYLYNINGEIINQITKGNWDVNSFEGVDDENNRLYYSSYEESSIQNHVYSLKFDGSDKRKISEKEGWNRAEFSEGYKYYIHFHSNANTPEYITLHNSNGKLIRVLEDNSELNQVLFNSGYSKKEFSTIKTTDGVELNAYMIKPADFDQAKQYPLFMFVYGGPGSQRVKDGWGRKRDFWLQHLVQKGYIVACVDNRGTGGRGEYFKKCTYKQLGKLETIDQIEAAKYFGSLPYIDESRIGIFGWSYGGFMSASCMTKGADYFKAGISVAPVTNWRYYDSVYTERYMRTPQENKEGYENNSPINFVDKLKGSFLLIHGTADDNVHVQNSIELSEALVQENKQFTMHFYKDRHHGISGGNTDLHIYTLMTNFILKNL